MIDLIEVSGKPLQIPLCALINKMRHVLVLDTEEELKDYCSADVKIARLKYCIKK